MSTQAKIQPHPSRPKLLNHAYRLNAYKVNERGTNIFIVQWSQFFVRRIN